MSETQKSPEKKQETPRQNGVELPHVQEARQLGVVRQRMREVVQRQRNAAGTTQERQDMSSRFDIHGQSFDFGPGSWPTSVEVSQENFVESAEVKDEREVQNARNRYQEQLKTTYDSHFQYLTGKPEEQKRLGVTYIEGSMRDLEVSTDNPGEDDVRIIAETFPDAWRATLLDPKTAENNPELQKMRDTILDRVSDGAASIDRSDFDSDQAYQDALRQNFEEITGIKLDPKKAQELFDANSQSPNPTSPEARLAGALGNTLGKKYTGDPEKRWDDMGDIPEIGVCSEKFPSPEELDTVMSNIRGDEGVTESGNPQRIREYHAAAGLRAGPSTPWCMSFVQYMARKYLGYNGPKTASARDGLKMGNSVQTDEPGCIVVTRGSGPSGCHIGIGLGNGEYISGNSGNAVKIKKIPSSAQFRSLKPSGGGH